MHVLARFACIATSAAATKPAARGPIKTDGNLDRVRARDSSEPELRPVVPAASAAGQSGLFDVESVASLRDCKVSFETAVEQHGDRAGPYAIVAAVLPQSGIGVMAILGEREPGTGFRGACLADKRVFDLTGTERDADHVGQRLSDDTRRRPCADEPGKKGPRYLIVSSGI